MTVPKEGFIRKHLNYGYVPYVEPESLLVYLRPDQYKIIGLPKKKDYDGDSIRKLYYIGMCKGKLVFHIKRCIAWKSKATLVKLHKKISTMFGILRSFIETDQVLITSNR